MAKNLAVDSYSMKRCKDCCLCTGGGKNVGRKAVLWTIGICTAGIGLVVLPFSKKCTVCGHNMFMNQHSHEE